MLLQKAFDRSRLRGFAQENANGLVGALPRLGLDFVANDGVRSNERRVVLFFFPRLDECFQFIESCAENADVLLELGLDATHQIG